VLKSTADTKMMLILHWKLDEGSRQGEASGEKKGE
jgi:hypothetical protein